MVESLGSAEKLFYLASSRPMRDPSQKKKKLMAGTKNDMPSASGHHMHRRTGAHYTHMSTDTRRGFLNDFLSVHFLKGTVNKKVAGASMDWERSSHRHR